MAEVKQHTCYTMPMSVFIRIITGEEPEPVYWEDIFTEYIGLRENKDTKFLIRIEVDIKTLVLRRECILAAVPILAGEYNRDLVNELKKEGCKGRFDFSDKAGYSNDLRAATTYAKRFNTQIKAKQKEIDVYRAKYSGKQIQRKDFEVNAVTLMDHFKMNIDYDTLTVARWCEMNNKYEMYCEVRNATNRNLIANGR